MRTAVLPILALVLVAGGSTARADDLKRVAAEHFALAQKAEERRDWRTAIAEYEAAYQAAPHPSVLFNIGNAYQQLQQNRNAAEYFRRYLDDAPAADDAASVRDRIERLRALPSAVTVQAQPAGATVLVNGERRGTAPLTVELRAGTHQIAITDGRRTSEPRTVRVEYGDPATVEIDLDVLPGTLIIDSAVRGAEVRVDGELAGYTPFRAQLPAGSHRLMIVKPGYRSVQREVELAPEGSVRIRAELQPLYPGAGSTDAGEDDPGRGRFSFSIDYGGDVLGGGARYVLGTGMRVSDAIDVTAKLGGTGAGGLLGVDLRYYFLDLAVSPYARAGVFLVADSSESSRALLGEAAAGFTYRASESSYTAFEYYVEIGLGILSDPLEMDGSRYALPVSAGIAWRWGG